MKLSIWDPLDVLTPSADDGIASHSVGVQF